MMVLDTTLSCGLCENTINSLSIYGVTSTGLMDGLSKCRNLVDLTQGAQSESDPIICPDEWNHDKYISMWLWRIVSESPHHCIPIKIKRLVLNSWQHLFVSWRSSIVVPVPVSCDFVDEAKAEEPTGKTLEIFWESSHMAQTPPFSKGQSCAHWVLHIDLPQRKLRVLLVQSPVVVGWIRILDTF